MAAKNCVKYTRLFRLAIFLAPWRVCKFRPPAPSAPPAHPTATASGEEEQDCVFIVAVKVRALLIETRCLICSSSTVGLENLPSSNHRLKVNGKKETLRRPPFDGGGHILDLPVISHLL